MNIMHHVRPSAASYAAIALLMTLFGPGCASSKSQADVEADRRKWLATMREVGVARVYQASNDAMWKVLPDAVREADTSLKIVSEDRNAGHIIGSLTKIVNQMYLNGVPLIGASTVSVAVLVEPVGEGSTRVIVGAQMAQGLSTIGGAAQASLPLQDIHRNLSRHFPAVEDGTAK